MGPQGRVGGDVAGHCHGPPDSHHVHVSRKQGWEDRGMGQQQSKISGEKNWGVIKTWFQDFGAEQHAQEKGSITNYLLKMSSVNI